MLTMVPPCPRAIMVLPTACDIIKVPLTLIATTRSNCSRGMSSGGVPQVAPLLLTRMSIAPNVFCVSSTTWATSSGFVISQANASALPPRASISCFTPSHASSLREQSTTFAPTSDNAFAMYSPRPRPPPVIMAVLPSSRNRSRVVMSHLPFSSLNRFLQYSMVSRFLG